jgi:HSP20 family protein
VSDPQDRVSVDLAEEARRLLLEIERDVPGASAITAECRPPLDAYETATALEIVVDVPGVPPESLRVIVRRNALLIVGAKTGPPADPRSRFHLAERSYGRFARAIRVSGVFDGSRAKATARRGELRIALPLIAERRGRSLRIPVTSE